MESRLHGIAVSLALALATIAGVANARITTVTITGTTAVDDPTGVFTNGGIALAGTAFTFVHTADDTTPGAYIDDGSNTSNLYGGEAYGLGHPSPGTGVLTINGKSFFNDSIYYSDLYSVRSGPYGQVLVENQKLVDDSNGLRNFHMQFNIVNFGGGFPGLASRHDTLDVDIAPIDNYYSRFGIYNLNNGNYQQLSLNSRHICVSTDGAVCGGSTSAAPEPAAWALMISGFGLAGVVLRRRRTALAL